MSDWEKEQAEMEEYRKKTNRRLIILFSVFALIVVIILIASSSNNHTYKSSNSTSYGSSYTGKTYSSYSSGTKSSGNSTTPFTNKYGTRTTKCAHKGCNNYIASSGDTNCCTVHSNKCLNCGKYIDEDAMYCMDCLTDYFSGKK